jgi:hypothetical protein
MYYQRWLGFREAMNRSANKYGFNINDNALSFDLYQARYSTGAANLLREIEKHLERELNILVLSNNKAPPELKDAINLSPGIFGLGIDLKKMWRWLQNKWQ